MLARELGPPPRVPEDGGERFRMWVEAAPGTFLGPALADVLHHVETFWDRRNLSGVGLFHYDDMILDLPGQLRRLADLLNIDCSDERITQFSAAGTFDNMKARESTRCAPRRPRRSSSSTLYLLRR